MFKTLRCAALAMLVVAVAVVALPTAFADGGEFTTKELRAFEKFVEGETNRIERQIRKEARGILKDLKTLKKDVAKGRVSVADARINKISQICEEVDFLLEPIVDFEDGDVFGLANKDRLAIREIFDAGARRVRGDGNNANALNALDEFERLILECLRCVRREQVIRIELEKNKLKASLSPEDEPAEFKRIVAIDGHAVRNPEDGELVRIVRPGIQKVAVNENGAFEFSALVPFDEPDSFVGIKIQTPDGLVIADFTMQQKESESDVPRVMEFSRSFSVSPGVKGKPLQVIFTSAFSESLLPLVDPIDCLLFLFPGTPITTGPSAK